VRLATCVAISAAALLPAAALGSQPGPQLPLGHAARWVTDATGRVVTLHGLNEVYKVAPYYPSVSGFGDDDAAFLAAQGFNAVRLGVIYTAVEPQPGQYDDRYLEQIAATVDVLARHGIVSLLDFHQDLYNERFQGEGFPSWAVQDDGLPNPALGFPGNYLGNLALERAFDHFWNNDPGPGGVGLQDRFAAAWGHVAERFRNTPGVLGYEILNEPWPGTLWEQCVVPTGCPAFDAKLGVFERRVDAQIRRVDPNTLVWYEPNVLFNDGVDTQLAPLGDPQAGFAFHDYCLTASGTNSNAGCDTFDDLVFANALRRSSATSDALLMTEFGATDAADVLGAMLNRADRNMVGWLEWAYTGNDITTSGPGDTQALVIDPAKPPSGSNVRAAKLAILARPYPQVVAGTPESWAFDPASGAFTLRYTTSRADGQGRFGPYAETDIAVPPVQYPNGFSAVVEGGAVLSAAGPLRIAACPGATQVTLSLARSGAARSACAVPSPQAAAVAKQLFVSARPARIRVGRRVRVRVRVRAAQGGRLAAVVGATVQLGSARARTGSTGVAVLSVRLRRPGARHVVAHARGFRGASFAVRAL
jgi:endoglycosylceramidase